MCFSFHVKTMGCLDEADPEVVVQLADQPANQPQQMTRTQDAAGKDELRDLGASIEKQDTMAVV